MVIKREDVGRRHNGGPDLDDEGEMWNIEFRRLRRISAFGTGSLGSLIASAHFIKQAAAEHNMTVEEYLDSIIEQALNILS